MNWRQTIIRWLGGEPNVSQHSRTLANLSPHERYPEIMHWREDDQFEGVHGISCAMFSLISITADGWAYGYEGIYRHENRKVKLRVSKLIGRNISLRNRTINEELQTTGGYMQIIAEFNNAFAELQERDKKLKLVS